MANSFGLLTLSLLGSLILILILIRMVTFPIAAIALGLFWSDQEEKSQAFGILVGIGLIFLVFLEPLVLAYAATHVAGEKNRSGFGWIMATLFLGAPALLILLALPVAEEELSGLSLRQTQDLSDPGAVLDTSSLQSVRDLGLPLYFFYIAAFLSLLATCYLTYRMGCHEEYSAIFILSCAIIAIPYVTTFVLFSITRLREYGLYLGFATAVAAALSSMVLPLVLSESGSSSFGRVLAAWVAHLMMLYGWTNIYVRFSKKGPATAAGLLRQSLWLLFPIFFFFGAFVATLLTCIE